MRRLILLACLLALTSGCGKGKSDTKAANSGSGGPDTRPALTKDSAPLDIAKDLLTSSGYSDIEVVSSEQKSVTLHGKPALVLHLQWRTKGSDETKNEMFLIQDQRAKDYQPYDAAKSFDENASALVKKQETP